MERTAASKPARSAATLVWVIAGLTLLLGILVYVQLGAIPWVNVGFVAVFVVLGFLVRRGSVAALWVAVALYAIDALLILVAGLGGGGGFSFSSVVVKGFFIFAMVRSASAMRTSAPA
jgi:hypothetical protein